MKPEQRLYSIEDTAKLLSVDFEEVHRLLDDGELTKRVAITGASIQQLAVRKNVKLAVEAGS